MTYTDQDKERIRELIALFNRRAAKSASELNEDLQFLFRGKSPLRLSPFTLTLDSNTDDEREEYLETVTIAVQQVHFLLPHEIPASTVDDAFKVVAGHPELDWVEYPEGRGFEFTRHTDYINVYCPAPGCDKMIHARSGVLSSREPLQCECGMVFLIKRENSKDYYSFKVVERDAPEEKVETTEV